VEPLEETGDEVSFLLEPCGSGGRLELEACHEIDPRTYPRTGNGTPVFCRVCEHLQQALNQGIGRTFWSADRDPGRRGFCRLRFFKQAGRGGRLFEPGELSRLTTPRCAMALSRLDRGILDIRDLLRDQHREWRPLHDLLCLMVTSLFSVVSADQGVPYLTELVWETYVTLFESAYRMHALFDDRTLFREMVRNWTYHQATFRVTEEEERFTFTLDPCGSGGRLFRGEMGPPGCFRYGSGLISLLSPGSDLTFQRTGFPVYCIHCAATNRDQFLGRPWPFIVDGSAMLTPEAPCRQYLYKKSATRRAPPDLLRQVGLEAVKPLRKEYLL
jgi:hypothetical protein